MLTLIRELFRPRSNLSPAFEALNEHIFRSGIPTVCEMRKNMMMGDVAEVAAFRLGFDPNRLHVVTVMRCEDGGGAIRLEAQAKTLPEVSGVNRNGTYVMTCSFTPPDPIVEQRFTKAFLAFRPPSGR